MAARGTITLHYGLTGVLNALWGATLPATDARLDLGEGLLGGLLMALAAGALAAMPVAGWLADRWGGRRVLQVAAPAASFALTGLAVVTSVESLMIAGPSWQRCTAPGRWVRWRAARWSRQLCVPVRTCGC